jgi:hypothetical protein
MSLLAVILALAAMLAHGGDPAGLTRAEPVYGPDYSAVGLEWMCEPITTLAPTAYAESIGDTRNDLAEPVCGAGLDLTTGTLAVWE